ncbi:MAG: GLPGLI family protein [Flavobacteriaceae bacterium]
MGLNKIFYLCIFLTLSNFQTTINSGEVVYQVSFNKEKVEARIQEKPNVKGANKLKFLLKNSSEVDFSLKFSRDESLYKYVEAMESDASKGINITKIFAGNNSTIYYNNVSKEILSQTSVSDETYLISKNLVKWKMTSQSKIINNYKCFKAISLDSKGKETGVVAWYAPAIPFNYGPGRFNNLPGLILELEDKMVIFRAKKIKLNKKKVKIKKPNKGIPISYEDFKKRYKGIFDK